MFGRAAIEVSHLPSSPGVYRIINAATGDCYIGGSACVRKRAYQHAVKLANRDHEIRQLQQSYEQQGAFHFRIDLVDICELGDLTLREMAWIEKLQPVFNTLAKVGIVRHRIDGRRRSKPYRPYRPRPVLSKERVARDERRSVRRLRRAQILRALRAGVPNFEIAKAFNVSESYPSTLIRFYGLAPRKRGRKIGTPNTNLRKVTSQQWDAVDWNIRDADIARQVGVSRERVRQVRRVLGKGKSLFHYVRREKQTA